MSTDPEMVTPTLAALRRFWADKDKTAQLYFVKQTTLDELDALIRADERAVAASSARVVDDASLPPRRMGDQTVTSQRKPGRKVRTWTVFVGFSEGRPHIWEDFTPSGHPCGDVMAASKLRKRLKYRDIRKVRITEVLPRKSRRGDASRG